MSLTLSIVMSKGGVTKTFLTLNLAYYLGSRGYSVFVGDLNTHKNAYVDCLKASGMGEELPFLCQPVTSPGTVEGADFVLFDCNQDLSLPSTQAAIALSDFLVVPVVPDAMDLEVFEDAVATLCGFKHPEQILIFPNKLIPLKGAKANKRLFDLLDKFKAAGCRVPDSYEDCPVVNTALQDMTTRFVLAKEGEERLAKRFRSRVLETIRYFVFEFVFPNLAQPKGQGTWSFVPSKG